ncbi:hypothetical protein GCM10010240_33470 [Streptomyces griseoviridis]|nr:hypothetical protein GCM10010240_33470 [Streptomyces griseoviridis]
MSGKRADDGGGGGTTGREGTGRSSRAPAASGVPPFPCGARPAGMAAPGPSGADARGAPAGRDGGADGGSGGGTAPERAGVTGAPGRGEPPGGGTTPAAGAGAEGDAGRGGRGGTEAGRASVLMHPPFPRARAVLVGGPSPAARPGADTPAPGTYPHDRTAIPAPDTGPWPGRLRRACASLYGVTPYRGEPVRAPAALARIVPLPCGNRVWQAALMTAAPLSPRPADRARYDRATAPFDAPLAIVDLEAFDANADDLVRRAGGKPVRVASKSVRCRALLERVLAREGFAGVMSYTLAESLWLARSGFTDVLLAYPSADRAGYAELAADPKLAAAVTVLVDDPAQLDLIDAARAGGAEVVRVCLELDTSLKLLGGRIRVGARRSPLHSPADLADLARAVARRPGFRVVGIMAYEGHVAGVGDAVAGRPLRSRAVRLMQAAARRELAGRRAAAVAAVRAVVPDLEFVNGGGTGSVQHTAAEEAVTEIAAGSGLYVPRLFDNYTSFRGRPAALFAQPVVRRPGVGVVTVLGGGYPASGAAGADRSPVPYLPEGLRYDPQEGAGEVQTPLLGPAADDLLIGDKVWFRHAKAGELCERFDRLHLVAGDTVTATVPTYRGEGHTFL